MACSAGFSAGIIGFNGISGFLYYIVIFLVTSFFLVMKCEFNAKRYFIDNTEVMVSGLSKDMIVSDNLVINTNMLLVIFDGLDNHLQHCAYYLKVTKMPFLTYLYIFLTKKYYPYIFCIKL